MNNQFNRVNKAINKAINTRPFTPQKRVEKPKSEIKNIVLHRNDAIAESKTGVLYQFKDIAVWINKEWLHPSAYTNIVSCGISLEWNYNYTSLESALNKEKVELQSISGAELLDYIK